MIAAPVPMCSHVLVFVGHSLTSDVLLVMSMNCLVPCLGSRLHDVISRSGHFLPAGK